MIIGERETEFELSSVCHLPMMMVALKLVLFAFQLMKCKFVKASGATGPATSMVNQAVASVSQYCETLSRQARSSVQGGFSSILKHGSQRVMMNWNP